MSDPLTVWPAMPHAPGLPLWVNGTLYTLRYMSLTRGPSALPVWEADVDGSRGCAGSLEAAILMAAGSVEKEPGGMS